MKTITKKLTTKFPRVVKVVIWGWVIIPQNSIIIEVTGWWVNANPKITHAAALGALTSSLWITASVVLVKLGFKRLSLSNTLRYILAVRRKGRCLEDTEKATLVP